MAEAPTTPTTSSTPPSRPTPAEAVNLLYPETPAAGSTPAVAAPATEGVADNAQAPDPASAEGEAKAEADGDADSLIRPKAEASPEEGKKDGEVEGDGSKPEPLTAASYEFTLPPEVVLDEALTAGAKALFAEHGLDPKAAQPFVDFYVRALTAQNEANVAAWNAQDSTWRTELHALPDFASATKRSEAQTMIGRLLDDYGDPALGTEIHNAGLGNNPRLGQFLLKTARLLTEGGPARPGSPVPQTNNGRIPKNATPGQILYEMGGPGSPPQQ